MTRNMAVFLSLWGQFQSYLTEPSMNIGSIAWSLNIRMVRTDMGCVLWADTRRCPKNCSIFAGSTGHFLTQARFCLYNGSSNHNINNKRPYKAK